VQKSMLVARLKYCGVATYRARNPRRKRAVSLCGVNEGESMRHVILGWGSLLWGKGSFPLPLSSQWDSAELLLPLEFSRVSQSRQGALTLVIDPENGEHCPTSFANSSRNLLADAICDLRCREGTISRRIGFVDLVSGAERSNVYPGLGDMLRCWAEERGFASVVWTDLPSNFNEDDRGPFTVESATEYLRGLNPDGARRAREYITCTPANVVTPLRRHLENSDWWASYGAT